MEERIGDVILIIHFDRDFRVTLDSTEQGR